MGLFGKKAPVIKQEELANIVNSSEWEIIDMRGSEKFNHSKIKNSKPYVDETKLDSSKKILVVCNQGIGAKLLAKKLKKSNLNAFVLEGGFNNVQNKDNIS